jgi:hypothetical protein
MARSGFRARRGGFELRLDEHERDLLLRVLEQYGELLAAAQPDPSPQPVDPLARLLGLGDPVQAPTDPALARLFPSAYRDDADAAADFRRFTQPELLDARIGRLRTVMPALAAADGPLAVPAADVQAWLQVLNDLRLVLGTRLGIEDEAGADLHRIGPDDPRFTIARIFEWLGWLLQTLVEALSARLPGQC